jgi:sugar O-acyltransferase (sialic acid O-acetyltransferase NeuD family)
MLKEKDIIILGTGGNCIDILDSINEINEKNDRKVYNCLGFLDDNINMHGKIINGAEVLGSLDDAKKFPHSFFVNGIGSQNNFWKKKDIISKTKIELSKFENIVHPTASVSKFAKLGLGVVIFQNVSVTSNVSIGNHVIILPNSIISHDVSIGDYSCITGGVCISGNVKIGEASYLGTNSSIKQGLSIGNQSLIGIGSVILKDVEPNSVYVGNPGKYLRDTVIIE